CPSLFRPAQRGRVVATTRIRDRAVVGKGTSCCAPLRELFLRLLQLELSSSAYQVWQLPKLPRIPNIVSGRSPMRERHFTCSAQSMLCSELITTKLPWLKRRSSTRS